MSARMLEAFEAEQAAKARHPRCVKREPIEVGRLMSHDDQAYGGEESSEIAQDTISPAEDTWDSSEMSRRDSYRNVLHASESSTSQAWATHPSIAARQRSSSVMPPPLRPAVRGERRERENSILYGADQPDIKPQLGWYDSNPGEEALKQIATMQAKLNQRLGPEYITSRAGPGQTKLWYIEGWKAIDLANDVFGFNGWRTQIIRLDTDFIDPAGPQGTHFNVGITAIMRVTLRDGTFHEDVGYGHIENGKGKAASLEKAKKEAVTDALKRSLRTFGRLVGNCVYDKKYVAEVRKMSAREPAFDKSTLYRRTEFDAPRPQAEPELNLGPDDTFDATMSTESSSGLASSSKSGTAHAGPPVVDPTSLKRSYTSVPNGVPHLNGGVTNGASKKSMEDPEMQKLLKQRREEAIRKQAAFRVADVPPISSVTSTTGADSSLGALTESSYLPREAQRTHSPVAMSTPRPQPQLKRAPPVALPPSPPKQMPTDPAAQVYARNPASKWARPISTTSLKQESAPPDVSHEGQAVGGFNEEDLKAAFDLSQGTSGVLEPGVAGHAKPTAQVPVQRQGSAGRFVSDRLDVGAGKRARLA